MPSCATRGKTGSDWVKKVGTDEAKCCHLGNFFMPMKHQGFGENWAIFY